MFYAFVVHIVAKYVVVLYNIVIGGLNMDRQDIRDRFGKLIAYIQTEDADKLVLRTGDGTQRKLGYYSPSENRTYDANQRAVGTGNLLNTLLPR